MCHNGRSIPLLLLLCTTLPAQQPPISAEQLLEKALIHNRAIAAVEQRIAEMKGQLRQAGVRPALTFDASGASGQPLRTKGEESYSAGLSRQFETSGKRAKRVRVAEYGIPLAEAELSEYVTSLKYEIRIAFASALADQEKLQVLGDLLRLLSESLRLTEARVNEGDAARLDADLLRVEISRIEAQHAAATGQLEADLLELERLAGLHSSSPLTLPPDSSAPANTFDAAQLHKAARAQRPDLITARLLERQTTAGVDLAEAEAKPDVTLSLGYTHQNGRFDDQFGLSPSGLPVQLRDVDNVLSVGVSVPLSGRRRNLGNIESATARAASARLRREFLERSIPQQIDATLRRYDALLRSVTLTRDAVLAPSEKNLEIIRQTYNLGQLRLLDVLNEQRRLLETRLSYVDSIADLRRALAELERIVGGTLP